MTKPLSISEWLDYRPDSGQLNKKIILVTGAAEGIGRAISQALCEAGATVLMLDKKARHLEKLYDHIVAQDWQEPVILPVDLLDMDASSATALAQAVYDDFGSLDAVLHNAAELGSPSPLDQYDLEFWQQVIQTNLQAPYLLTRALLPLLKKETTTQLLFTSADLGRSPKAYGGAYSIAYAGLEAQMVIWARELERTTNIKVNSIDPGPVRTVLRRRSHPGEDQASLRTPQSIVGAYLAIFANQLNHSGAAFKL